MSGRQRHWTSAEERLHPLVYQRDGWRCQIQGPGCLGVADQIDHKLMRGRGGIGTMANMRAVCHHCNNKRNNPRFSETYGNRRAPLRIPLPAKGWTPLGPEDYGSEAKDGDRSP